ncbi:MAG TPA: diguanylate cyclase [Rhodanobacteraceae bacterium]|nr:diguanylate cyclase [Rhodanobacteraceae bacterium]
MAPALLAGPERVANVLNDLRVHGYASPATAAARLQAARDADDPNMPLDQKRRYSAALIWLALPNRNMPMLKEALDQLRPVAQPGQCPPCRATWLIGKAQESIFRHRLKQARTYLRQVASLVPANDPAMRLELLRAQVRFERAQGALNTAFGKAMAALSLADQLGNSAERIEILDHLATMNAQLGFVDRAVPLAREAASQAQAAGFTAGLGTIRIDEAFIYASRDERDRQRHALMQALAISRSVPGLGYLEVTARGNLSDYYLNQGDYASALKQAQEAAVLARASNDQYSESIALANKGIATVRMGQTDAGLSLLHRSLELARRAGHLRTEVDINREIVKVLESAGRYREALQAQSAVEEVNRKITEQERDSAVLELQAKYDDEHKNREIDRLSAQDRLKGAENAAQRWQQRLWITLAGVALLAASFMVLWLMRARRANRRLVEDVANLTEQSSMDALTGILNRRSFSALMQGYTRSDNTRLGLALVDIDDFKQVNDSLGHDVGDVVLVEIARRLQLLGRSRDHVARWGGEEFVLALPDVSPQSLPNVARCLLDAVTRPPVRVGGREVRVSVSAGFVAHPPTPGTPWGRALRLADVAMYRAKRDGGNRAVCVITVGHALDRDVLDDADLDAAIRSGSIVVAEIQGSAMASSFVGAPG